MNKQKLIIDANAVAFKAEVNKCMEDGWTAVPGTLDVLNVAGAHFVVILEKVNLQGNPT